MGNQLQEICNLFPDQDSDELVRSFAMETNDMMLALYLGSMLRSTVALHNLINNKIKNKKQKEKGQDGKEKKSEEGKEKKGEEKKEENGDDKKKEEKGKGKPKEKEEKK